MSDFTEQERHIIELCRERLPAKEIAEKLGISPRTVDNHKNNIFRKLGINSTYELIQYAVTHGIVRISD
jgi:DNA-binding NarL/FixJ family response regulator